jgi:ubiquinone biosynthesis protein COQ9
MHHGAVPSSAGDVLTAWQSTRGVHKVSKSSRAAAQSASCPDMPASDRALLLDRLADATLRLAPETVWEELPLRRIAEAAEAELAECLENRIDKARVREQLERRLDRAMVEAGGETADGERRRDRLFDAVMARFETMEAHRAAWTNILMSEQADASGLLARTARRARSAHWALEAAGVAGTRAANSLQTVWLTGVIARTQDAWLQDGPDLSRTMRTLDGALQESSRMVKTVRSAGNRLGEMANGFLDLVGGRSRSRTADDADTKPDVKAESGTGDGDAPETRSA